MNKNAIEIKDLHKGYHEDEAVLNGLDMTVPEGSVYGLIGRNGAGKSTFVRQITGVEQRTRGKGAYWPSGKVYGTSCRLTHH